jgi:hypothetical protein
MIFGAADELNFPSLSFRRMNRHVWIRNVMPTESMPKARRSLEPPYSDFLFSATRALASTRPAIVNTPSSVMDVSKVLPDSRARPHTFSCQTCIHINSRQHTQVDCKPDLVCKQGLWKRDVVVRFNRSSRARVPAAIRASSALLPGWTRPIFDSVAE